MKTKTTKKRSEDIYARSERISLDSLMESRRETREAETREEYDQGNDIVEILDNTGLDTRDYFDIRAGVVRE